MKVYWQTQKLQPERPEIDEHLICAEIEILYQYVELVGSSNNMWCWGVVSQYNRNRIHIEWDASTLHEGDE